MSSRAEQSWQAISRTLAANTSGPSLRLAILAAHPDDETIGASTLMSRFPNTEIIFLTDGAPRESRLWSPDFRGSRDEYARLRRSEAEQTSALAGVPAKRIHWLGAVDQEGIHSTSELSKSVSDLLADVRPDVLVTHPYEGGHPDHDAAALVARVALAQLPADRGPLLIEMTSYHACNCQCVTGEFLNSDRQSIINIELSEAERSRKKEMFAAYSSQRMVLSAFGIDNESFRLAPMYDFLRPPHEGRLWYECMGWPMTGERWRELAAHAAAAVQECACR